jgi:hypothetical protein
LFLLKFLEGGLVFTEYGALQARSLSDLLEQSCRKTARFFKVAARGDTVRQWIHTRRNFEF